ncbi:MAG: protein-L-isoaspartate(D-aspartate) O-methyltransferase [Planctomycetes bacterium]|nr:protein-L-isoaspartate(D-aspartate) O-methyltransferase [Planctomycetota bacterium]
MRVLPHPGLRIDRGRRTARGLLGVLVGEGRWEREGDGGRRQRIVVEGVAWVVQSVGVDPSFFERVAERRGLVGELRREGIADERVLRAIERVPRHAFVPVESGGEAYVDGPLPIGRGQTISQPWIVARMTEALELGGGERVLEIGTGCGYQTAVLAELAREVFTIELEEVLGVAARERLGRLGYGNVEFWIGDGSGGWPEAAPFDAILAAAAPARIPPRLLDQLARGGRLCMPVGDDVRDQELVVVHKRSDGTLARTSLGGVRFVPFRAKPGS